MPFVPLDQADAPEPRRGFIPIGEAERDEPPAAGFVPLESQEPEQPSALRKVLDSPLSPIGEAETALNLATQAVALPLAGLAGLGTEAARAVGLTERKGADVVHAVGSALTYEPRGQWGQDQTGLVMVPFEKLAEAGQHVGGKVLDATGSPLAATVVDTAINAAPLAISPAVKGAKAVKERMTAAKAEAPAGEGFVPLAEADAVPAAKSGAGAPETARVAPEAIPAAESAAAGEFASRAAASERHGFIPLDEVARNDGVGAGEGHLARDPQAMHAPGEPGLPLVRRAGDQDGAAVAGELREVPGGGRAAAEPGALAWTAERAGELRAGERGVDPAQAPNPAQAELPVRGGERPAADSAGSGVRGGPEGWDAQAPAEGGLATGRGVDPHAVPNGPTPKSARYALIEADNLRASHDLDMRPRPDHPENFGRKDATRHDNEMAVEGIIREFEPERLGEALTDEHGAPIVARDGVVEAGNRRANALQRIYRQDGQKAIRYRGFLRDNAQRFGLAPEQVYAMKRPVLVRLPDQEAPRRAAGMELAEDAPALQGMAAGTQSAWAPGRNYAPLIDDARAPASSAKSVADLPAPMRREKILGDLAKALGTTIYEGRVKGKRLGFFRPKVEEVRIKKAADLEVAAHEIAHLIDKRVPAIANVWRSDKALREELRSVSYDQKSIPEGFAEGMRLFLSQPDVLAAKAPKVFKWLDDFASSHQYGPALRKAQEQMTGWFAQDALNRARSKIGEHKPLSDYLDGMWDKFRQATVDDLHGVYRMERELKGGKLDKLGPYESARLSRASASIADGAVRFGYPVKKADGSFTYKGKGLEQILKPVAESLDDALLYFVGRSSRELLAQGRERLFSQGEIDAMLRLRTPEREAAFKEYQAWNKGILDFAEAQGVINPESRRLWQRASYLPFHRVGQPGGLKGKPGDWSGVQQLTGGTQNLRDILGNMVGNAALLIDKAVKNEARLKIAELAEKAPGAGRFMVKIDPAARPVKVSGDQVIDAMLKKYGIAIDGEAPAFFQFLVHGQPPGGANVVAVLRGGKPTWYEVGDPILMRALEAIDRPLQNWVVKWLGMPKRVGQASIVLSPDFMLSNVARDTLAGAIMSRAGFRPVMDSLQGMRLRVTNDPLYKEYIANGGGLSSIYLDEAKLRTKLQKFYARQGVDYRTVLDSPSKLLNFVETLGDAFEMSTRLGEFRRAVQRGENPRHAAYLGREVSTDFAMMGDAPALQFAYSTVMFLRPAVVSMDRLFRGVAHDANKGAIAAKTGMLAMSSMALYLLNRDDPRYADLPDWDRDTHWHFFIGDQHFRYPKIWEIGALASAAERSAEKLMDEDPAGLGKDFARILGQTFHLNLMPQALAPLYEQATNRNSFTKAPLETPGMENLQPFLRSKPGTSETMKAAGMATRNLPESLQLNPVRAEALVRGYFNTWALYGLMLTDQAFFGDRLPEKRADELPVVRRFYSQEPPKHTKHEMMFYEMLGEAKRLQGTLRELDEVGRSDIADQKERSPLAGEAKPLARAAKSLSGINNEMRAVRRDATLTPAEKRARLDALTVERNALLKAAVQDAQAAQKEKAKP